MRFPGGINISSRPQPEITFNIQSKESKGSVPVSRTFTWNLSLWVKFCFTLCYLTESNFNTILSASCTLVFSELITMTTSAKLLTWVLSQTHWRASFPSIVQNQDTRAEFYAPSILCCNQKIPEFCLSEFYFCSGSCCLCDSLCSK